MNENSLRNIEQHKKLREEVEKISKQEQVKRVANRLYAGQQKHKDHSTTRRHNAHERK